MVIYWSSHYCSNSVTTEVTDVITKFPLTNLKTRRLLDHLVLFPAEHSPGISLTGSTDFHSKIYEEHSVAASFI